MSDKKENDEKIYGEVSVNGPYFELIKPMMEKLYERLRNDIMEENSNSPIFKHHINHIILGTSYNKKQSLTANVDDIVVDYIASMTDDYFIDLYAYMFPEDELNKKISYVPYFEE